MMVWSGCASARLGAARVESSVHAPAALVEPYVPEAEPVEAGTATTVTLEQLLVYADAHAPVIQTARARAGVSEGAVVDAAIGAPSNPEVGLGVGGRTSGGGTGLEVEVSVQQQLALSGEPDARRSAAAADRRVAEAEVNEVRWAVHGEVHRLFVDVLLAVERRVLAERFVAFSKSLREVAGRQVEAGESSPLILLVADADLAQTREALVESVQLEASLRARVAGVVGWPSATLPPVRGELPPLRRAPEVSALLETMAAHHPAVRTRELSVLARQAGLEVEQREASPQPTIGLGYGREAGVGVGEAAAHVWMFTASVPMPLWRANQGGQRRAEAELDVADKARAETVMQLRSEVVQAAIAVNAAADRVELYTTGVVPQLAENLALLQRAYELGEVDVHQVSQTRERLLEASGRYLEARVTYFESAARLEGLVGTELWSVAEVSP